MSALPAEHTATESSFGHFRFSTTVPPGQGPGLGSLGAVHSLRVFASLPAAVGLCLPDSFELGPHSAVPIKALTPPLPPHTHTSGPPGVPDVPTGDAVEFMRS